MSTELSVVEWTTLSAARHRRAKSATTGGSSSVGIVSQTRMISYIRRPYRYVVELRSRSLTYWWSCSSGAAHSKPPWTSLTYPSREAMAA